jgi:S1-C subfamily serine protease
MPKYSSGAPILDEDGCVVGINTGLGRFEGREFGHANPVSSIRAHLAEAIATPLDAFAKSA